MEDLSQLLPFVKPGSVAALLVIALWLVIKHYTARIKEEKAEYRDNLLYYRTLLDGKLNQIIEWQQRHHE